MHTVKDLKKPFVQKKDWCSGMDVRVESVAGGASTSARQRVRVKNLRQASFHLPPPQLSKFNRFTAAYNMLSTVELWGVRGVLRALEEAARTPNIESKDLSSIFGKGSLECLQ